MAADAHARPSGAPYISLIVTTRNDDHGGDPLSRLQAFVNTFDAQCRRTGLDAEVIVVEWNPPPDRPRLHELLKQPPQCPFALRFVEVPQALHDGLRHASVLPLFQMIGKNVGIRRARGRFVLSTNIDIIFSNELVDFLASQCAQHGVMYRVDRHDIESAYPVEATLDDQMAYCASHQLRVHRSSGTYSTDPEGRVVPLTPDVFGVPTVSTGDGWHVREGDDASGYYRWATEAARLTVNCAADDAAGAMMALDIEPNPYDPASWVDLDIMDGARLVTRTHVSERRLMFFRLDDTVATHDIFLKTVRASPGSQQTLPAFERREKLLYRLRSARLAALPVALAHLSPFEMGRWRRAEAGPELVTEPGPDGIRVRTAPAQYSYCLSYGRLYAPADGRYSFALDCSCSEGNLSFEVLDEWRDRWIPADHYELVEGDRRRLFVTVELRRGQAFSLYVTNCRRGGDAVSVFVVHAVSGSAPLQAFRRRAHPRALAQSARQLVAKIWRGATYRARRAVLSQESPIGARLRRWIPRDTAVANAPLNSLSASGHIAALEAFLRRNRPDPILQNACGDFQLMAREHWFELRGFPEFNMYSMNIDGLFGDIAHNAGIREQALEMPLCIYHLEHEKGSGWTPEGEALLRKRIAESGITWLDASTVSIWAAYMAWLKRPMIFNGPDWGFGDAELPEMTIGVKADSV